MDGSVEVRVSEASCFSFWKRVETQPSGCMLWVGAVNRKGGYGRVRFNKKYVYTHRIVPLLVGQSYDSTKVITHRCDTPRCVNPLHLKAATQAENLKDMVSKRRHHWHDKSQCRRGHDFSGENLYMYKDGRRGCRTCMRIGYDKRRAAMSE